MQQYAAFHLSLHCLPKYQLRGFQYTGLIEYLWLKNNTYLYHLHVKEKTFSVLFLPDVLTSKTKISFLWHNIIKWTSV